MHNSNDTNAAIVKIIAGILGWLVLVGFGFLTTYYAAFVLRDMWQWFVVPSGYAALSTTLSLGIVLIAAFLKFKASTDSKEDSDKLNTIVRGLFQMLSYALYITFSWGAAAIWHFWALGWFA